ncbi:glycosyltransferase [Modestobacter marinus]|uniref:Glycosyl transferase n=1 Tax=Modestobacter marinus TaxID=477641 RepID=A0A846LF83_9ACTN|nr:glycosyltransferase family 4 protein [Modestobacter marinus]NIH66336.1 glycosyltransferase involved in cell wall biosynthesis [Modestobacter marinus]GGL62837.1 glycosyl transferase [Modestobacter marinus]
MSHYRVAHLTNTLKLDGTGFTNSTTDLMLAHAAAGHEVAVFCHSSDDPMRQLLAEHGIEVFEDFDASSPKALLASARSHARQLRSYEVLHVHTVRTTLLTMLAAPLHFLRRSVSTLHNPYQRSVFVMYLTRRIVSISAADRDYVHRRTRGLRRPTPILNGTLGSGRLPSVESVEPADLPGKPIVYVGAIYERKGVDVLLKAMQRIREAVPGAHLYLVGNRDNPAMERLATDLGLDDVVTWVGFSPDPRAYMKAASVFVLPSRAEGFGNVLTEARSTGTPIVASNVGGIPEALSNGKAGLLVEPEDEEGLAQAIVSVLTEDELAARLRVAALTDLESASVQRAAREYEAVYATVAH